MCGFLGCDVRPFNPALAALPQLVRLRRPAQAATRERLEVLIELTLAETREPAPGAQGMLLRLGELMFVVLGMTMVMLAGGIDLSVGSNFALTTFLSLGMFNALGWPALALPCGPAEDGLPASVQLVGRPGTDALVLAVGETLEAALS